MKNYKIFLLPLIILTGCFTEPIELDLNQDAKKVAIVAWINDLDERQYVDINYTINYLGRDTFEYIPDASVVLSDAVNNYTLVHEEKGRYFLPSDFEARVGDEYTLEVLHKEEEYIAKQVMRPCPEILDLELKLSTSEASLDSIELTYKKAVFNFQEIPGEGDAYLYKEYTKGNPFPALFGYGGTFFFHDEFFDGEFIEGFESEDGFLVNGDTLMVELYAIDKDAFNFFETLNSELDREGSPFDPPPANVATNFSGGAIGYFIASGAQRRAIVLE